MGFPRLVTDFYEGHKPATLEGDSTPEKKTPGPEELEGEYLNCLAWKCLSDRGARDGGR